MKLADPLAPPMKPEPSDRFMARKLRRPDEPQMGIEPLRGERGAQPCDPARYPPGPRVPIRPFERKNVKLHGAFSPGPGVCNAGASASLSAAVRSLPMSGDRRSNEGRAISPQWGNQRQPF